MTVMGDLRGRIARLTVSAKPVKDGFGVVDLKTVMLQNMCGKPVEMLAGQVDELVALHTFKMEMAAAFLGFADKFIACTGA